MQPLEGSVCCPPPPAGKRASPRPSQRPSMHAVHIRTLWPHVLDRGNLRFPAWRKLTPSLLILFRSGTLWKSATGSKRWRPKRKPRWMLTRLMWRRRAVSCARLGSTVGRKCQPELPTITRWQHSGPPRMQMRQFTAADPQRPRTQGPRRSLCPAAHQALHQPAQRRRGLHGPLCALPKPVPRPEAPSLGGRSLAVQPDRCPGTPPSPMVGGLCL